MSATSEQPSLAAAALSAALDGNPVRFVVIRQATHAGAPCYTHVHTYARWETMLRAVERKGQTVFIFPTRHEPPGVPHHQESYGGFKVWAWTPAVGFVQIELPPLPFHRKVRSRR